MDFIGILASAVVAIFFFADAIMIAICVHDIIESIRS